MKKEEQIKRFFQQNAPVPDPERRRQAIQLTADTAAQRSCFPPIPFWRRLLEQCRHLSAALLLGQALFVLALFLFFGRMEQKSAADITLPALSAAIPILGIFSMPELCKSYFFSMWELERTCRYNLRQLMTLRLTLLGIIDAAALIPLTLLASRYAGQSFFACALYLLVPFFLCCTLYLCLFRLLRYTGSGYVFGAAGIAMAAASALICSWGTQQWNFYTIRTLWAWALVLVAGILACAWMLYINFYKTTKKEASLPWN